MICTVDVGMSSCHVHMNVHEDPTVPVHRKLHKELNTKHNIYVDTYGTYCTYTEPVTNREGERRV